MDNLSNSFKSKQPKEKVAPVVEGKVEVKKKSDVQKIASSFFQEDMRTVGDSILTDVIMPSIKKTIYDIFNKGMGMLLYGSSYSPKKQTGASKISFMDYYNSGSNVQRAVASRRSRSVYDYDEIVIYDKGEADSVLERMDEIIEHYGMASVADLYDLVGVTGDWTNNKYGWTDLSMASVVRVRDGYLINLPRAEAID